MLHLKIITPEKQVYESDVEKINCQTIDGEVTILPKHEPLLTLLKDGVITVTTKEKIEYFSAGSGYVETDGNNINILISQAVGQAELDEAKINEVKEAAEKLLKENRAASDRQKAMAMLIRANIGLKILDKVKRKR